MTLAQAKSMCLRKLFVPQAICRWVRELVNEGYSPRAIRKAMKSGTEWKLAIRHIIEVPDALYNVGTYVISCRNYQSIKFTELVWPKGIEKVDEDVPQSRIQTLLRIELLRFAAEDNGKELLMEIANNYT